MVDTGEKLSELSRVMEIMPQALVNAKVPNHKKDHYLEYPEIADAIDRLNTEFAGQGRVLIRPSGTEPMVRVMIEGKDQEKIQKEAEKLAGLIQDIMF
jgi:phosphoglucosamine mutase